MANIEFALPADVGAKPKRRRPKHIPKPQPISRAQLDGRLGAAKRFDTIVSGIATDLGGENNLTTVQRYLVDAFAGAAIHVNHLNARMLLGEEVDLTQHATAVSTLVRLASRIGTTRVAKEINGKSPLDVYLDEKAETIESNKDDEVVA